LEDAVFIFRYIF